MTTDRWSWTCEREMPSDAAAGRVFLHDVLHQLDEHDWSEQEKFGVHLAVEEAVVNAIKHGNQDNPSKIVNVTCRVSKAEIYIHIGDEGDGFNPDDIPDPTQDENLEIPSGRGLMLMRTFMDRVEFNDVGNQVEMEKRRSG